MVILCYSTNKILYNHMCKVSKISNFKIFGKPRKKLSCYFTDLFRFRVFKNQKLFIYNTSPANLISSFFSKTHGCSICYHIHDPIPHSNLLNPILYLIQVFQLLLADNIIVFNSNLIDDVKRIYPLTSKKIFHVFEHGKPHFSYSKTSLDPTLINFGFFGRNMPYKNVDEYIYFSKVFSGCKFHIFGKGYGIIDDEINVVDKFIDNDKYYSYMLDVDYVVLPYKNISFSGIISDAIALDKKMIVSELVYKLYKHDNMVLIDEFLSAEKQVDINNSYINSGWESYHNSLVKL